MRSSALLVVLIGVYASVCGAQICEDGWVEFESPSTGGLCILIVKEPMGWQGAERYCEEKLSNLMYLDRYGTYSYFVMRLESEVNIGQELVDNSIRRFWSGMYVDNARLMWDDYGPHLVSRNRGTFNSYWNWGRGHPDPTAGQCGQATIPLTTNQGVPQYSQVTVNLTDCSTRLPFICQKSLLETVVKRASFCSDNWVGNQYIPYCYRIYKELVSSEKGSTRCQEEGGILAPSLTLFDWTFLMAVFDFYREDDKYFYINNIISLWVENSTTTTQCSALDTISSVESLQNSIADTDCDTSLLYICAKPTTFSGSDYIETQSPYFHQADLLAYLPFRQIPVYGVLDRILDENEVVFARTPSYILNSTGSYKQWEYPDNTVTWIIRESNRDFAPYYVNVSIPRDMTPQRRRRDTGSDNGLYDVKLDRQARGVSTGGEGQPDFVDSRFIDYDYVRRTTGYYTFGIYHINPPRYLERPPQLVRYSERDLYIYVAYCNFLDGVIGPASSEQVFNFEDIYSFNLLQDDSYIAIFREIANELMQQIPASLRTFIEDYRAQIEYVQNNTAKFRIFVFPSNSRTLSAGFEQLVYEIVIRHFQENIPIDFFNSTTLRFHSTVMCPFLQTVIDGKDITFQPIPIGNMGFSWERCYPDNNALASAKCTGNYDDGATWGHITVTGGCSTIPKLNESESTTALKNLSETELTRDNVEEVLAGTFNLTLTYFNLTEVDIIFVAEILYNYLQFDVVNTVEIMDWIIQIVNNILKSSTAIIDSAQKITNAANRIIHSIDELTNQLQLDGNSIQFVQDLVATDIWEQFGDTNLTIGIKLNKTGSDDIMTDALSSVLDATDVAVTDTDTAIYLTASIVNGGRSRLTFHIYSNPDLFSVVNSQFKVNSKVVAARLTKNDIPIVDLGDEYATAVFYPFEDSKALVCAYWNYSANQDAGGWDTKGCTLFSYESGRVICKCNHLTNFAVLIDVNADTISDTNKLVLGIITKVGLCLSIIGLGITVVTFLVFRHLRKGRGQQVLVNLSVAILCSSILFLVGVERTESRGVCIAVAALLHYFILVTFMWMLVEGVLQYLRFVKVLGTYIPNFMMKSMIPAWGIPLIPVIICMAIDYNMYYGGKGYCVLSWGPFLYAFMIPVALIIVANIVVFMLVMCNLCCRRKHKGMASNQSERKMAFLHVQAAISILVILGLTWLFGFLTVDNTRVIFHYLFAIFNAFQGFFIFLLFTAREQQIRKAWRKMCCKAQPYKTTTTSVSDSRTRKPSADTTNTGLLGLTTGGSITGNPTYNNP